MSQVTVFVLLLFIYLITGVFWKEVEKGDDWIWGNRPMSQIINKEKGAMFKISRGPDTEIRLLWSFAFKRVS